MRQILQDLGTGKTTVTEAPCVAASPGSIVTTTRVSLISAGTERMLVDFGRASLLDKARQQPDKVRMVLNKVVTDGLTTTIDAVRSKLSQPIALGYCNVGTVHAVGAGVEGFRPGDRVVSNGSHADVVRVPVNLCARIPDGVDDDSAAFTVVAAIGLQGIRLANPTLGEAFVVIGAGLIGLLTVQLLRAHGCRVLAIDFDADRLKLAALAGAETCNPNLGADPVAASVAFSHGRGVDGVVIAASTASSDPVTQAAQMCRKRGRIVLVGVAGLTLNRADFYEKELSFQVSCSYGPGRYDPAYEDGGQDYPIGFVRWTEQRNFEAVLDMLADGRLDVSPLITHRIPFDEAPRAYGLLTTDKSALGILLGYAAPDETAFAQRVTLGDADPAFDPKRPVCAFIGAGNYASRVLMPAFRKAGAQLHTVVTTSGVSAVIHGGRQGFAHASTDIDQTLRDRSVNLVAIVTRHGAHARLAARALGARKHVFVEKPLALTLDEVAEIEAAYAAAHAAGHGAHLMVGFNRRFAPQVARMKSLLAPLQEPKSFIMTMNSGAIPPDHWTQDIASGGGRIVGEACHFIDLMRFLAGTPVVSVQARRMGDHPAVAVTEDKATITLGFDDGSFGTIHYFANGSSAFPKERVEVFCAGRVLQLDNFRRLRGFGWPGFRKMNLWRQDKGQDACAAAFLHAVESGTHTPIPADEIFEVARVSIEAAMQLRAQ